MQHDTRLHESGHSVPTTHARGRGSSASLVESNSDEQPHTLPQDTASLYDQTSQTRRNIGQHGYDQNFKVLQPSIECFSSTCLSSNLSASPNDTVVPHSCRTTSPSRLTVTQEGSDGSLHRRDGSFYRDWKWEILSLVISLGLLAGIFVALSMYNHGIQPEWPYGININSLISVLTTVMIAQLGFILAEGTSYPLEIF